MGKFNFIQTELQGVFIIEPTVFGDERGYFMETYQKEEFAAAGIDCNFVQDNQSKSSRGVLRGLHFQKENTQGKLVRVVKGEVFDVAVDCRPIAKPLENGQVLFCQRKINGNFMCPKALPMVFWC